jgi:hypothetical protein
MFDTAELQDKLNTVKFGSGLTWNEAEIVTKAYMDSIKDCSLETQIHLLRGHLERAVREYDYERKLITALAANPS